jgi:hypothetical protein
VVPFWKVAMASWWLRACAELDMPRALLGESTMSWRPVAMAVGGWRRDQGGRSSSLAERLWWSGMPRALRSKTCGVGRVVGVSLRALVGVTNAGWELHPGSADDGELGRRWLGNLRRSHGFRWVGTSPPNKPLKQTAAPRRDCNLLPLARGEVPRARSSLADTSRFADAAAA